MSKYTGRSSLFVVLAGALALGACGRDAPRDGDNRLAQDSALARDLQLAGSDAAVQPQLQDLPEAPIQEPRAQPQPQPQPVPRTATTPPRTTTQPRTTTTRPAPVTERPAAQAPAPAPSAGPAPAPAPTTGTIAAGTTLNLRSTSRVCTNTHRVGDRFTATTTETVVGSNGATIPAGATVTLTVTQAKRSESSNDRIVFEFAVNSISFGGTTYPASGQILAAQVDRVRAQGGTSDAQKVATGAVVGAIAGQVLGRNTKSTVIGGAVGAAAGAATAAATADFDGCVPDGGNIRISLNESVTIRV
jgi:hypothetical protein